jgi:trk system potassium uptake protein TrkA
MVFPESDIADRVVRRLMTSDLIEHIEVAPDVAVVEMPVPAVFLGKSLAELDIRAKHELHVIGVVSPDDGDHGQNVTVAPPASTVFHDGEVLLLLGRMEYLNRFTALYQGQ